MKDLINNVERMTSIEIAEVTGKQHKNVMQAIRKMESAWEKICGRKFALTSRTISLHGRKLLRENFTSVHKIYPLAPAPCSLPLRKQSFRNFNSLRKNTPEQDDCL